MTASGTGTGTGTETGDRAGTATAIGGPRAGRPRGLTVSGMRPPALLRLALAGTRTDTLRVVLTGVSAALATLALLSALTVLAITSPPGLGPDGGTVSWAQQYTNALLREPGLRPGVALALIMLTIPVLALAGQCARLGAPARDRRLAAIRLAGASPRQAVTVAAAETGAASLLGTCGGLGIHFAARALLHRPDAQGRLPLPTDVLPSPVAVTAVVLGIPLLAALATVVMLRKVIVGPLGVSRAARARPRDRAPRPWPGVVILLGLALFAAPMTFPNWFGGEDRGDVLLPLSLFGGGLLAALGVVLGTGWITHTVGRLMHRFGRGPAALLAARRLMADPWHGGRTLGAALTCVVFGAGAAVMGPSFSAMREVDLAYEQLVASARNDPSFSVSAGGTFYIDTMDLVDTAVVVALVIAVGGLLVALAEGIVSRRCAYAALVATGVPRRVLGRAILWQAFAPVIPAVALALTVGTFMGRSFGTEHSRPGVRVQACDAGPQRCAENFEKYARTVEVPEVVRVAQIPYAELALYGLGTLVLVLGAAGAGLLFLRSSTAVEELRTG